MKGEIMGKTLKVLLAAATGFVAGVLMAPKSGEENRKDLRKKVDELKGYAEVQAEKAKDISDDVAETVKKGAANAESEVREFAGSALNSAQVVVKEATQLGKEAKERALRVAEEARRDAK